MQELATELFTSQNSKKLLRYINESHEFRIPTDKDLTAATGKKIRYTKPDTTTGIWTATVENGNELVYRTTDPGGVWEINQTGDWKLQGEATIDGRLHRTEIFIQNFKIPIS